MTAAEIRAGLVLLRNYYAKDGKPYPLNDAQWAVYIAGLMPFDAALLESACHAWMRQSKWFPALSDLLELMRGPEIDRATQAHLAWTTVERAIRRIGAYQGVTFVDAAIGEAVLQVFGSWAQACAFDVDSPGWAIRRQTFLAVYPTLAARSGQAPVTLRGLGQADTPVLVGKVAGLPLALPVAPSGALTHHEARAALAEVTRRASLLAKREAS